MTYPSQFGRAVFACLLAVPGAFAQDTPKDFVKDILRDQKQLWTSPFRMKGRDVKWWLIFGAATGALIATDHRSAQVLPNTADQIAYSRGISRVGAVYTLIPIAGGLYLGGLLTGHSKLRETGFLGGEAVVDSLIVSEIIKAATRRQRPLEGDGGGHFYHGSDGFPSGHTIDSFALASVVAHEYQGNKGIALLAYGFASVVGAARFSSRQHNASDIVAGAAMGWFIGRHVSEARANGGHPRGKAWLAPELIPQVQPSGHSYGLMLAWHSTARELIR
jgi:membrane-associated phospholipid phosphatase